MLGVLAALLPARVAPAPEAEHEDPGDPPAPRTDSVPLAAAEVAA